jgi:hypothetical protein
VDRRHLEQKLTAAVAALGLCFGMWVSVTTIPQLQLFDTTRNHPLMIGLRSAHADLNRATGWGRWEPKELQGTAAELRALAVRYDNAGIELQDAAVAIDTALADDDRERAVVAHRIVAGLEHRARDEILRERARLHLPPA